MSIPPPPVGWAPPDPTIYSSNPGAGETLHNGLKAVADTLNLGAMGMPPNDARWQALKMLRVLRAGDVHKDKDLDNLVPQTVAKVARQSRLSRVIELLGVNPNRVPSEHMDWDWFGKAYQNFWPGQVSGSKFEDQVAEAFQQCIESSYGLAPSINGSTGAWDIGGSADWQAWLRSNALASPMQSITIKWSVGSANPSPPTITWVGTTVEVLSQMPSRMSLTLPPP